LAEYPEARKKVLQAKPRFYTDLRNYIARLNPDGTLDESFDPGRGVNNSISSRKN
jgi:hypothetical protein